MRDHGSQCHIGPNDPSSPRRWSLVARRSFPRRSFPRRWSLVARRYLTACLIMLVAPHFAVADDLHSASHHWTTHPIPNLKHQLMHRYNQRYGHSHSYGGYGRRGYGSISIGVGNSYFGHRRIAPFYGNYFYYGVNSPYGIYYNTSLNHAEYYLPPVFAPAELAFGPQAHNRFLGVPPAVAAAAGAVPVAAPLDPPVIVPKIRESNAAARERADRFVEFGDALFREQKFHDALQRYKSAAEAAPDLAEIYFRQGHALVATHRPELAVKAFKLGLRLSDNIERDGFVLDQLYGGAVISKVAHLEALAETAMTRVGDPDAMFLVALFLFYDGQADRARKFFLRAAELDARGAPHLAPFLKPAGVET